VTVCVFKAVFVSTASRTFVLSQAPHPSPRLEATELAHQPDRRAQTCRFRWDVVAIMCAIHS